MCGRFCETASPEKISKAFSVHKRSVPPKQNRYNIAPGQPVLAALNDSGSPRFDYFNWGLVPSWSKDPSVGSRMINARSETIHEKPSFKKLIRSSRCAIAASGFYEWKSSAGRKQPYFITSDGSDSFAFAGLYTSWTSKDGSEIWSCTIITAPANQSMSGIHHRMPVIMNPQATGMWLDKNMTSLNEISGIIRQSLSAGLKAHPVSTLVNSPGNDSEDCIKPVESEQRPDLFAL